MFNMRCGLVRTAGVLLGVCLHDCGLVKREQHGRYVIYHLADDRVEYVLACIDELLAEVARGVFACVRYNS